jgi:hypothetical protein
MAAISSSAEENGAARCGPSADPGEARSAPTQPVEEKAGITGRDL